MKDRKWYSGKVTGRNKKDGTFSVEYDDGDSGVGERFLFMRKAGSSKPSKDLTYSTSGKVVVKWLGS